MLARATFKIVTWDKEPVDEREGGPDVIGAQGKHPERAAQRVSHIRRKKDSRESWGRSKEVTLIVVLITQLFLPASQFVILANAGIQGRGLGGANEPRTPPPPSVPNSHNLVCGWQPAWAIGMKARGPKPNRNRAPAFGQGG